MTIFTFYKRHRQFMEIMSSNPGLTRSRYIRLMIISGTEICGTIPLGLYYIVYNAKNGVTPWTSWADMHSQYSTVNQIAGFIWKNDSMAVSGLELYRWSLILCAFDFFALFGFADEARQHYRRVYTTIASRIGYSTFTLQGSSHACVVYPLCSVRPGSSGLHRYLVLQYIVCPLREEQGRHHGLCSHNGQYDKQAEIQHLIRRPTFNVAISRPHRRQDRSQDRGVFAFGQHGIGVCGKLYRARDARPAPCPAGRDPAKVSSCILSASTHTPRRGSGLKKLQYSTFVASFLFFRTSLAQLGHIINLTFIFFYM